MNGCANNRSGSLAFGEVGLFYYPTNVFNALL